MKIINMLRIGIPPPQPPLQEYIIIKDKPNKRLGGG